MSPKKDNYDVVVVGSGAGAGPVIYTLTRAGHKVLVLEKGPWYRTRHFRKDELTATRRSVYTPDPAKEFHSLGYTDENGRMVEESTYDRGWDWWNGNMVGGSTNVMSGYFQRMKPVDFRLLSEFGEIPGADIIDWPISYDELEPYYEMTERLVGISGRVVSHRFAEPRSTPDFPYPPLKENTVSSLIDKAAAQVGYEIIPTPRAILSRNEGLRRACYYSNFCGSYGCASDAKGSSRVSLIREALKTGNLTLITGAHVYHLESDGHHRIRKAWYMDPEGKKHAVEGRLFVVAAQAVESVRLLLLSKNPEYPEGIGNGHGLVGKNMVFSAGGTGSGEFHRDKTDPSLFERLMEPGLFVNRSMHHFYVYRDPETDKPVKGGTVDFLWEHANPVPRALRQTWQGGRSLWGTGLKQKVHDYFTGVRRLNVEIFTDWIPYKGSFVSLSRRYKDFRGFPVARIAIDPHPGNMKPARFLADRTREILEAMGLQNIRFDLSAFPPSNLQAGGLRFGHDPAGSVLDKYNRVHEADNLFVTDGSFMPTGGSVPFTWTIYANSFRVADYIKKQVL